MCGLLLAVIMTLSGAAYFEMRRTSHEVAAARLVNVTTNLRDLLQQSGAQLRGQVAAIARGPDVIQFARSRDPAMRARTVDALKYVGQQPEQVVVTELRDQRGVVLRSAFGAGIDTLSSSDILGQAATSDSAVIGSFRLLRDTIVYPVAARVAGGENLVVVQWRRVASSARSRDQLTRLIGSDASLFVGNVTGNQWTDMQRPIVGPPSVAAALRGPQTYLRSGANAGSYLISAAAIPGTPWQVAVDFPLAGIQAPVNAFLRRMILIGLAALGLGLLVAWVVGRRITDPLLRLTHAADAVAGGDYAKMIRIDRSDELGRLGRSFVAMTIEIQHARDGLEHKVDDRTRDLNATLVQLREAQDTLVRREKLAILGQLAGGVGHELRNPLGVMTNALYYLKVVLAGAPQNVKDYLEILQQQITLSEKIVGDLLDFARLKPPQRTRTSVEGITHAQVARLGPTNGVHINTDLSPQIPDVLVDAVQMGQMVFNLLTNAVQAIDGAGMVTIRARANGDSVEYEVADTGPGIPAEHLEKIFEPLFTTKARGIGLGLAVSRTLARANDGDLTVATAPRGGAVFRLTLPVAPTVAA